MISRIVRLCFVSPVHFGEGLLESSGQTLCADTLFSALCHEILLREGMDGLDCLVTDARRGAFRISDAFPRIGSSYYLPKPAAAVRTEETEEPSAGKAFKKLRFLPVTALHTYLGGKMTAEACRACSGALQTLGTDFLQTNVCVPDDPDADSEPYYVGGFRYQPDCGLWVLLCTENAQQMERYLSVFSSLGESGIGGKRSAGFGRFRTEASELPGSLSDMLEKDAVQYMSLSLCLPQQDETEAVLNGASYLLVQRSGFVASDTYADSPQKKKVLHMFAAGSCFPCRFHGDVFDVSDGGRHPVYRYGIPLLLGL